MLKSQATGRGRTQKRNSAKRSPLVSVVIPAYNHERFISDTIGSVLNQGVKDLEAIIVNDGSTDATGQIIDTIRDERVRVIHQQNSGTASAINRGLSLAKGKYISILNSDDLYHEDRLKILIDELERDPECYLALSKVRLIDIDGRSVESGRDFKWLQNAYTLYEKTHNFLLGILRDNFTCTSSNFVFRGSLIEGIGYFRNLRYVNDLDFLLRAIAHYKYRFSDMELLNYRIHRTGTLRERKGVHRSDFVLELSWVLANLLDDKDLYSQIDMGELFNILHEVYHLNLETMLFCWSYLKKLSDDGVSILEDEAIRGRMISFIDKGIDRELYIHGIERASKRLGRENEKLFAELEQRDGQILEKEQENARLFSIIEQRDGQILEKEQENARLFSIIEQRDGQILEKEQENARLFALVNQREAEIRQRDAEINQLSERADEIWREREWFRFQLETILNSRKYRFITHLNELRLFRNLRYNAKEIIKVVFAEKYVQRLRALRHYERPLTSFTNTFLTACSRIKKSLTPPARYTQNHHDGPLVSVISPCFNYGRYLDQFLACLQEQSFRNFEVILIDDGSTDGETIEKIEEIEAREIPNLRIIRQENKGVIAARNRAISMARGRYIFPFDPDDAIDKTFLEKGLLYLESCPPHYFVYFWTYSTGGDSDFIWKTYDGDPVSNLEENRVGFIMFPLKQFHETGGYNPVMKEGYEDWEFCVHLMRRGYVGKAIPEPLYHYLVKAEARNYFAIQKHELLKKIINDLHKDHIHRNWKKLKRIKKKRWRIANPLVNLVAGPETSGEEYCLIDLYNKKFNPAWTFSRILRLADSADQHIIVTIDDTWRGFFDLNSRPNVYVYGPENYHPEGDVRVFYDYIETRYGPQHLEVSEIGERVAPVRDTSNKINILYVAPWLIMGGADAMTIDWFRNVDHETFNKYFIATVPRPNTWIYKIRGYAREIYELPLLKCTADGDIEQFLLDFIEDRNIHIVHIMNSQIGFRALPSIKARYPNITTVAQFHCFDYLEDGKRVGYPYDVPRRYDSYVDFYNVVSHNLKHGIIELFPYIREEKFKVIYCCVDTGKFRPDMVQADPSIMEHRQGDKLNILFIGRLDRQKQPLVMAQVARELKKLDFPFVIHVLGEGSLESQKKALLRYIDEHDLSGDIKMHGDQPLEAMASWYKVGDVLLMTSAWEGIPVVLYEAMSMKLVCIAPDVGGISELLGNDHGYLIKDREDIQSYVNAVVEIGTDKRLREALGEKARAVTVHGFDMDVMKHEYQRFYKGIAG
jgi:glycosyltransferase involved in cell wall biosynthesis